MAAEGLLDLDAAARFIGETPKELERLVRAGAVPRQDGRFHPIALVRGYVEHVRAEARRANDSPTQVEIGAHLDMSDRNVRDVLHKLGLDPRNVTLEEVRIGYVRYLRELAAGRGGDDQGSLTRARTRQALAEANIKELEFFQKVNLLTPTEEIEPAFYAWSSMARSEIQYAVEKLISAIQSQHGIEVDQKLIDDTFTPAFRAVREYPAQLRRGADSRREGMDSAEPAGDAAVAL